MNCCPVPSGAARHLNAVELTPMVEPQAVVPRDRVGLMFALPMFTPRSIRFKSIAGAVGALGTGIIVATGASYEKVELAVANTESAFTTIARELPEPCEVAQRIIEALAQDDNMQAVFPTATVGVVLANPKLTPYSVATVPPVDGAFAGFTNVTAGASNVKAP